MTPNQFLLIVIVTAIVFLIIGVYIGYLLANKDNDRLKKQVGKMDVTELFKRHHGISD